VKRLGASSRDVRLARARVLVLWGAALYPTILIVLSAIHLLFPQRAGLPAVTQIFAPYLFLPLVALIPFAFMRGAQPLRLLLLACALIWVARFFPRFESERTASPGAETVSALSWNVFLSREPKAETINFLATRPADIVALSEAYGDWPRTNEKLSTAYPYRLNFPDACADGIAILSKFPILEQSTPILGRAQQDHLRMCLARLDVGGGKRLTVIAAHPHPPWHGCTTAICVKPEVRDRQIAAIREAAGIDRMLADGTPFLMLGDFNVTDREPTYRELSRGLRDAFLEVGQGPGNTWAPYWLMRWGVPLLRIDYHFSSPNITPLRMQVDCTPLGSDHCRLHGLYELLK
jgi:vancomycin resistance protein VanJ